MRERDRANFVDFVTATHDSLYRTSYLLTGNPHSAEDLLQAVLTKLYLSWSKVNNAGNPIAYARRSLINESISMHRRRWTTEVASSDLVDTRWQAGPEDAVVETQVVWEALRGLTSRQRAVMVLRYYENLTEAEIAEVLGLSPGTVKGHARAALSALESRLETPYASARIEEEGRSASKTWYATVSKSKPKRPIHASPT